MQWFFCRTDSELFELIATDDTLRSGQAVYLQRLGSQQPVQFHCHTGAQRMERFQLSRQFRWVMVCFLARMSGSWRYFLSTVDSGAEAFGGLDEIISEVYANNHVELAPCLDGLGAEVLQSASASSTIDYNPLQSISLQGTGAGNWHFNSFDCSLCAQNRFVFFSVHKYGFGSIVELLGYGWRILGIERYSTNVQPDGCGRLGRHTGGPERSSRIESIGSRRRKFSGWRSFCKQRDDELSTRSRWIIVSLFITINFFLGGGFILKRYIYIFTYIYICNQRFSLFLVGISARLFFL